jgi:hypothetical protein
MPLGYLNNTVPIAYRIYGCTYYYCVSENNHLSRLASVLLQRDYEEFKVRINALVAKAQKTPEEGWTMEDGTPWPGNDTSDHPGMIQVNLACS